MAVALCACGRPGEPPLTSAQLQAKTPYDLGPEAIDVSGYPREQQDNYLVFTQRCGLCHTLARPVNSPASGRTVWERYVGEMHSKSGNVLLTGDQARQIADFLVFDAERRKRGPDWESQQRDLKKLFERVQAARRGGP